jgi:hypothetical protein
MEERILETEALLQSQNAEVQRLAAEADPQGLEKAYRTLQSLQEELDGLYARWAELEDKQSR